MTPEEQAELERLREAERAEIAAERARRDAAVAADRGRDCWDAGPPVAGRAPVPPRILGPGDHGDVLLDVPKTREELWEQAGEFDAEGRFRHSTWTEVS